MNWPFWSGKLPQDDSTKPGKELPKDLPTTFSHAGFTLVGMTFLSFEILFLLLYGNDFWFSHDLAPLGIPVVLLVLAITHFLLSWVESPSGCRFFFPLKKGLPLLVYRKWLTVGESGITFGVRHILWQSLDELELTIFGNLLLKSRAICGTDAPEPDLLFKLPFSCASLAAQTSFIELLKSRNSAVLLNKRLEKRLSVLEPKATQMVQAAGVVFMVFVLLDVGQATFGLLQMMKEYYLSQLDARAGKLVNAQQHLECADYLQQHPFFAYSWVNNKLLGQGTVAASMAQARSEALWFLGRKPEAIDEAIRACKFNPMGYRLNLRLARLLWDTGHPKEARQQIRQAIARHFDSLMPRLYMLAMLAEKNDLTGQEKFYDYYMAELQDQVFGDEPWWPPGGNRFLSEMFFQEDTSFIFDRLIKSQRSHKPPE